MDNSKELGLRWIFSTSNGEVLIEIVEDPSHDSYLCVSVNHQIDKKSRVWPAHKNSNDQTDSLTIRDVAAIDAVRDIQLSAFIGKTSSIHFLHTANNWSPIPAYLEYALYLSADRDSIVEIEFHVDADRWANPWTIHAFMDKVMECNVELRRQYRVDHPEFDFVGKSFARDHEYPHLAFTAGTNRDVLLAKTLGSLLAAAVEYFDLLIERATHCCRVDLDHGSLIRYFVFPPETKTACQQYLAYFSQFLRDIGIESDTQIKEEANRILFSVTPKDGVEALGAVREALTAYLQLPALSDVADKMSAATDIANMQLQSTILHLQSQLMLAKASMQMQSSTIEAKNQTIDAQIATIRALEIAGGQVNRQPDTEPLIGETISVTKVKKLGIELDLPALLRKLKRRRPNC